MHDFEFLRFVNIGQYLPTGSVIHRLDPRARLVAGFLLLAAITAAPRWTGLVIALVVLLAALVIARIPVGYALKGLLPPLPFIAFLAVVQILFGPRSAAVTPLWTWGPVYVSAAGLLNGALLVLRFAALILALSWLSFCISTAEIVRALDALLAPLTKIGLPTHAFVLMVQVTLRFLPLLALEAERIAKSQASRGAEWGTGRGGLLRRARQALPLLVPLFLTGLQRAENLALAMQARGYQGGKGRTTMMPLRFGSVDAAALALAAILAIVVVCV
ncbi:MAG: energy-coupling factor transporter transmembrane component T [Anaerolineae bacterium]|mgnify:CR=1 FL=1